MTGKELYEKHKGRKALHDDWDNSIGIIVGHDEEDMIMAVVEGGEGWDYSKIEMMGEIIYDMKNNEKGYLFVREKNLL